MTRWKVLAVLGVIVSAGFGYLLFSAVSGDSESEERAAQTTPTATRSAPPVTTPSTPPPTPEPTPAPTPAPDPVLVGAGDIASCTQDNDSITASLIDSVIAGAHGEVVVFTAGDNVYEYGTSDEFAQCYDPAWGRHKARTRPSAGNHDYATGNANGYFGYFGANAGEPARGYYSYTLGTWHIIVVNTSDECGIVECGSGSAQEQWLRADLAANPAACTMAIWHHPLFSSGHLHGSSLRMRPLWQALYAHGVDVVVNGHEHNYERFAPQDPFGVHDPNFGIRQFIVGTGGESHYQEGPYLPNSEVANGNTYGVMKFTLHGGGYDWEFIPEPGQAFTDSGSVACHGAPPPS
jgi:hypothetical protein